MKPITPKELAIKIENQVKGLAAGEGLNLSKLAELITANCDRPESAASLSQKLKRGSIKYSEILEISDILEYNVKIEKRR